MHKWKYSLTALCVLATGVVGGSGLATAAPPGVTAQRNAAAASSPIYLNPKYSPVERAVDLTSRMTLAEKAAQMNSSAPPAIPRLGVAVWGWWNERTMASTR